MRYLLTLFLIALVSTSEIIDKADEIKEFGEYEDVELQFLFGIIPIIGKIVTAGIGLFAKAKAVIAGSRIFRFVRGAIGVGRRIFSGARTLIQKSRIFRTGQQIFNKGRQIYNKYKGIFQRSKLFRRGSQIYNKYKTMLENSKVYQTYKKIKHTYDQGKKIYDNINRFIKNDNQEQEQEQNPQERQNQIERNNAFARLYQIKNDRNINYTQKQNMLNAHLNYMQSKGFITPAQRQNLAKITPTSANSYRGNGTFGRGRGRL
jgi:hypothetical protein